MSTLDSRNEEKKEERRKRRGAFWWWGPGIVVLAAIVAGGLWYLGFIGKGHAEKRKLDNAFIFSIDGSDHEGRHAAFDFIIFDSNYTWVKASTDEVESQGRPVPETEVATRVVTPKLRDLFAHSTDVIAVGLASLEGDRAREEERADRRAKTVANWLKGAGNAPLWELNLGQYDKKCKSQEDADTSLERPLIMARVRAKDPGTNLQQALADAISGKDNLPSRECYSRFDLGKVS